jgi:hypothetical protein
MHPTESRAPQGRDVAMMETDKSHTQATNRRAGGKEKESRAQPKCRAHNAQPTMHSPHAQPTCTAHSERGRQQSRPPAPEGNSQRQGPTRVHPTAVTFNLKPPHDKSDQGAVATDAPPPQGQRSNALHTLIRGCMRPSRRACYMAAWRLGTKHNNNTRRLTSNAWPHDD